jgi:hypothetical protein
MVRIKWCPERCVGSSAALHASCRASYFLLFVSHCYWLRDSPVSHVLSLQDAARERMRLRAEIAADKEARKVCLCVLTDQQCTFCLRLARRLSDRLVLCVLSMPCVATTSARAVSVYIDSYVTA